MVKIILILFTVFNTFANSKSCIQDSFKMKSAPVFNGEVLTIPHNDGVYNNSLKYFVLQGEQTMKFYSNSKLEGNPEVTLQNGILNHKGKKCSLHDFFSKNIKSVALCDFKEIRPTCNSSSTKPSVLYYFNERFSSNVYSFNFKGKKIYTKVLPSQIEVSAIGKKVSAHYATKNLSNVTRLMNEARDCINKKSEDCLSKVLEEDLRYKRIKDGIYKKAARETVDRLIPRGQCKAGLKYAPEEPLDFASREDYNKYVSYVKKGIIENEYLTFWLFYNKNAHLKMNNLFDYYNLCLNPDLSNKKLSITGDTVSFYGKNIEGINLFISDFNRVFFPSYPEPLYFDKNTHSCVKKLNFYEELSEGGTGYMVVDEKKGTTYFDLNKPISNNYLNFKTNVHVNCYLRVKKNGKLQVWLSDKDILIEEIYMRLPSPPLYNIGL